MHTKSAPFVQIFLFIVITTLSLSRSASFSQAADDGALTLQPPISLKDNKTTKPDHDAIAANPIDTMESTNRTETTTGCEVALNGGFENGLVDWSGQESAQAVSLSNDPILGQSSLSIAKGRIDQLLPAAPGDSFTFSGQYKLESSPVWVGAGVDYLDGNNIELGKSLVRIPVTAEVGVFNLPSVAPAGTTQIRVWLHTSTSQTPFIVDGVSLIHDNC